MSGGWDGHFIDGRGGKVMEEGGHRGWVMASLGPRDNR